MGPSYKLALNRIWNAYWYLLTSTTRRRIFTELLRWVSECFFTITAEIWSSYLMTGYSLRRRADANSRIGGESATMLRSYRSQLFQTSKNIPEWFFWSQYCPYFICINSEKIPVSAPAGSACSYLDNSGKANIGKIFTPLMTPLKMLPQTQYLCILSLKAHLQKIFHERPTLKYRTSKSFITNLQAMEMVDGWTVLESSKLCPRHQLLRWES